MTRTLRLLPLLIPFAIQAGDVTGQVTITKRLTPRRIALAAYERRGPSVPAEPNAAQSEMERVVVFLEGPPSAPAPARAVLNQKGKRFDRETLAVPAGSTVTFPNLDPIFHNVFSLSKAKAFDLGYYSEGKTRDLTFEKPGVVMVYCHLHPSMSAAIMVTPNTWSVQPEADGRFELRDVPEGPWQVVAWHKSAGYFRTKVSVAADAPARVAFDIPMEGAVR